MGRRIVLAVTFASGLIAGAAFASGLYNATSADVDAASASNSAEVVRGAQVVGGDTGASRSDAGALSDAERAAREASLGDLQREMDCQIYGGCE